MRELRVALLRGGPSNESTVSLKTGASILKNFPTKHKVDDILVGKDHKWYLAGLELPTEKVHDKYDVIFNALHGSYGEDGRLQKHLEKMRIPYTGSKSFPSALAMNKAMAKEVYAQFGLKFPRHSIIGISDDVPYRIREVFRNHFLPVVVKPVSSGSSVGITLVNSFEGLADAVAEAFSHSNKVMVEEFVRGKEATCGVLEDFRGEDLYALPAVEIVKPDNSHFFDYDAKYSGRSEEIVPGRFSREEREELARLAKIAHKALGLRHYSRSDFVVTKKGIYILETNTLPGLTEESLYPKSLEAVGMKFSDFVEHLINLAIKSK